MDEAPAVLYVGGHDGANAGDRLREAGFDVTNVVGEREAREAVRSEADVEVAVTRYEVPREDGIEFRGGLDVVETLTEERPELPIILFTRMANHDVAREVSGRDLFDYIPIQSGRNPYDRLVRRTETAARQYRTDRRIEQLSRINEIIRDVNRELVRAEDRADVERAVCVELTQRGAYAFARFDGDGTTISREAATERPDGDPEALVAHLEAGDGQVVHLDDEWAPYTAGIVVPVKYAGTEYGRVHLCTTRADAFSETEREVLAELGETIGDALDSLAARQALAKREGELAEQNERLEHFATIVSHDIRNPLQIATGFLTQLREEYDDDRIDRVADATDRIGTIVDDVLALARGGSETVETTDVDLAVAAERAWESVDTADATLEFDDLGTIDADVDRLVRLLENLVRNAVEHGGDTVTVTVEREGDSFTVADDGPGIPEDEREDVLEMGHSGDDGTGLGLAIVAQIAAAHDWTVDVEESEAGGARFVFWLDG